MTQAWFFAHLGLEATEDTGAIRRAYAVALKRIDQAREPAAFERLRDAYQRALDWARNPDTRDEDEPEAAYWEDAAAAPADEPPAPVVTPTTPVGISHAAHPGVDLAAEAERRDAAIADRIARLMSAPAADLAAAFDAALADPALGHLDARQQFEAGLIEALHEDPAGRLALFELAAERLDWRRDHAKLAGDWMANAWADRALDQADHFAALPRIIRRRHDYLLRRVARRPQPGLLWLWNDGPILASLQEEYPDWLELRLPPGRFDAWAAARAALSPRWERVARFIDPRRMTAGRLIGIILVSALLISFGKGWREATRETAPSDAAATTAAVDAAADGLDHALAYEFTGINDAEGCGMVADFAAGSNWLEVPDDLARALLVTRILDCRMRGWWPAGQEVLAACLRGERLAALSADRAENFGTCSPAP